MVEVVETAAEDPGEEGLPDYAAGEGGLVDAGWVGGGVGGGMRGVFGDLLGTVVGPGFGGDVTAGFLGEDEEHLGFLVGMGGVELRAFGGEDGDAEIIQPV